MKISIETKTMIKSWMKTFVAAAIAGYVAGIRDPFALLDAGVCAILPVIYSWFDTTDPRFGKFK